MRFGLGLGFIHNGGISFTGLLDTYSGAAAAYGLRRLSGSYYGSAIRVRRSSDNAEQDIGFTSSGALDTDALTTFVGANNGYVTTWYDQSSNGKDATQSTAAAQPQIVLSGVLQEENGLPAIKFTESGTSDYLSTSYHMQNTQSYFGTGRSDTSANTVWFGAFDTSISPAYRQYFGNAVSTSGYGAGYGDSSFVDFDSTIAPSSNIILTSMFQNGTAGTGYINGANKYSNTPASIGYTDVGMSIGAATNGNTGGVTTYLDGTLQEIIIYESVQTANRAGIETNLIDYHFGEELLLNEYTGAAAAYSLRKINRFHTGPLIRVRRTSDNAEQDIGFDTNGDLDTDALTTFVGVHTGFVTTWYDQSGNGKDLEQSTAARQPRIVDSGTVETLNSLPAVAYLDASLLTASSYSMSSTDNFLISCVASFDTLEGSPANARFMAIRDDSNSVNIQTGVLGDTGNDANLFIREDSSSTSTDSTYSILGQGAILWSTGCASGTPYINKDGSSLAVSPGGPTADSVMPDGQLNLFKGYNTTNYYTKTGHCSEFIVYHSDKSSDLSDIESDINDYYGVFEGPTTFDGFTISIPHTNWVGVTEVRMIDHDDNEWFADLSYLTEVQATTYAQVSAGEFATDSLYGNDPSRQFLNDGIPDITDPSSPQGNAEWSTNATGSGLEIYLKPSVPKNIKYMDLCINTYYGDCVSTLTLYSGDKDEILTPTDSPVDETDIYQTTSNGVWCWFRWTFPEEPTA